MSKIALPETVKFAKIGYVCTADANTVDGRDFKLMLGPKEIALLLSIRVFIDFAPITDGEAVWALYRKSLPAALTQDDMGATPHFWAEKDDICAYGCVRYKGEPGGGNAGNQMDDYVFPHPLVVIRNPALWIINRQGSSFPHFAMLYYLTRTVTDEDLAKLMVKDHA